MTPTAVTAEKAMNPALSLMAGLVLEDGSRWGEKAVEVQWEDAREVLDPTSETPYHFLTRSRGYSKTGDLAGVAVAVMLDQLPAASRLYALAADRDQGRLLIDSIAGYAARTPLLTNALRVDAYRVTATRTGSMLDIIAADAPGAYGLRPAFLVVDEAAQWASTAGPRHLWEATTTAMAKVPGARLVVLTSAGDPTHWSYEVLQHARREPLWRVHEVPGPPPWISPERLEEQRRRLPDSSYKRLFENQWTASEDRLTNLEDLQACVRPTADPLAPQSRFRYVIGVDLGLVRDRTAIAVCHAEPLYRSPMARGEAPGAEARRSSGWSGPGPGWGHFDGDPLAVYRRVSDPKDGVRIILDRLHVVQGSKLRPVNLDRVEELVEQASRSYGNARVVVDPWQAAGLAQRLSSRGIRIQEFTFSSASVARLASTLHLLLRNRAMSLPDDRDLLEELATVRLKETSPGVLRLDHDRGHHDDRAIALALAAQLLVEENSWSQSSTHTYVDLRDRGRR